MQTSGSHSCRNFLSEYVQVDATITTTGKCASSHRSASMNSVTASTGRVCTGEPHLPADIHMLSLALACVSLRITLTKIDTRMREDFQKLAYKMMIACGM